MVHLLRASLSRSPELRATPGILIIPASLAEDKPAQPCSVSVLCSWDFNWEKPGLGLVGMPGSVGSSQESSAMMAPSQGRLKDFSSFWLL